MKRILIYMLIVVFVLNGCAKKKQQENTVTIETRCETQDITETMEDTTEEQEATLESWNPEEYININETIHYGDIVNDEIILTETRPDGLMDIENGAGWG